MSISDVLEAEYVELLLKCNCTDLLKKPFNKEVMETLLSEAFHTEIKEGGVFNWLSNQSKDDLLQFVEERLGQTSGLAWQLKTLLKQVQTSAAELNWNLSFPVFAGEFPTGSFNAQAYRSESGAFLLMNTGLMMFIYQCAKLFSLSSRFIVRDFDDVSRDSEVGHLMTPDETVEALADIVLAYIFRGHSTFAYRYPAQGGFRGIVTANIVESTEFFVLAHEYGHAFSGHLTTPKTVRRMTSQAGVELDFVEKSWTQEIEADICALLLLLPPSKRTISKPEELFLLMLRLTGPFFFFSIDELINAVVKELQGISREAFVVTDHPPSSERFKVLLKILKENFGANEESLIFVQAIQLWFDDHVNAVCDFIKSNI